MDATSCCFVCLSAFAAKCLSWRGLLPFSRLTYMAFLIHPFVIWYHSASQRERFTASHFNYSHLFLGHYLLTYLISFFLGVCVESPCIAMIKLLTDTHIAPDTLVTVPGHQVRTSASTKAASHASLSPSPVHLKSKQKLPKQTFQACQLISGVTNLHDNQLLSRDSMNTFSPGRVSPSPDHQVKSFADKRPLPDGYYTHQLASRFDGTTGHSEERINRM